METDDFVLDDGCEGHVVENLVDFAEDRVFVGTVLVQPVLTLVVEAETVVDALVLVVAAQQVDLFRVPQFEG